MIYDNGASLKNKGIDFSRERFEKHLHMYYREHGSNDGYVLLMDYSKFYDNIPHETAYNAVAKHVKDDFSLWLLNASLIISKLMSHTWMMTNMQIA